MKVCRSKGSQRRPTRRTHYVEDQDPEDDVYSLFALSSKACEPIIKNVTINGVSVEMELGHWCCIYSHNANDLSEDGSTEKHQQFRVF